MLFWSSLLFRRCLLSTLINWLLRCCSTQQSPNELQKVETQLKTYSQHQRVHSELHQRPTTNTPPRLPCTKSTLIPKVCQRDDKVCDYFPPSCTDDFAHCHNLQWRSRWSSITSLILRWIRRVGRYPTKIQTAHTNTPTNPPKPSLKHMPEY